MNSRNKSHDETSYLEKTYQEQSNVERRSERGWWQREFRQRGSGKARSGSTTARSPAPSPGPETRVRRPVVRPLWDSASTSERERNMWEEGFIILLIFLSSLVRGRGDACIGFLGLRQGTIFCGVGPSQGAPTHQPAFSFDQTKHQTLTDALCHVLLYIDQKL